jgi:hypothetical protein
VVEPSAQTTTTMHISLFVPHTPIPLCILSLPRHACRARCYLGQKCMGKEVVISHLLIARFCRFFFRLSSSYDIAARCTLYLCISPHYSPHSHPRHRNVQLSDSSSLHGFPVSVDRRDTRLRHSFLAVDTVIFPRSI